MLDIALEGRISEMLFLLYFCFNPSYAGYCSGRIHLILPAYIFHKVSILLMLDIALEA